LRRSSARPRIIGILGCTSLSLCGVASAAPPTKDECIDANETAQSLRKGESLREAEQRLLICVSANCPGPVRDDCAQRLTEVRSVIPTIVFVVKDEADQDLSAVRVTMDGAPLVDKLDGTAVAVNPGQHQFVFEAEGRTRQEKALLVREGEKDRHERIVLAAPPVESPESAPVHVEPAPDGRVQRVAGIAVGTAGAVGVVFGAVFGLVAKSTYDHALSTECHNNDPNDCFNNGPADGRTAFGQATASTVAFVVGGVLIGGGALLYFTAPKGPTVAVSPALGAGTAGLALRGRW
jgi:hypothetical protein